MTPLPVPRLHSLEPREAGTAACESLYSFVTRLANSHAVPVNHLLRQLGPHTGQDLPRGKNYVDQFHDTRYGGSNDAVGRWVAVLESATSMRGLSALTYSTFGRLMTGRGSGAARRQWCPCCLDDDLARFGDPHLRLLWTVGHVTACPTHGCRLESVCHSCGEGSTPSGRRSRRMSMLGPGVCGSCGAWLGAAAIGNPADRRPVALATDAEVCAAARIGELIAKPLGEQEHVAVHAVLKEASGRYFGGSMACLARWVGLNKSTVHGWMSGAVVPELSRLVELALKLRIGLRDLVVGNAGALPASLQAATAGLQARTRQTPDPFRKRARLQEWLVDGEGKSIHGIAAELRMSHRDVYYYLGDAANNHAAIQREQDQERRAEHVAAAQDFAVATLNQLQAGDRGGVRCTRDALWAAYPRLTYSDLGAVTRQALVSVSFGASSGAASGTT